MKDTSRAYEFLKQAETYYLATESEGKPYVRPFGTVMLYNGRLYIQTGKKKDVSKQLAANPNAEICAMLGGEWIRISGTICEDDSREARVAMLELYPQLKSMYSPDDGNTQVLYFSSGTATVYAFTHAPEAFEI